MTADEQSREEFESSLAEDLRQVEAVRQDKLQVYHHRRKIAIVAAAVLLPLTMAIDYYLLFSCKGDLCDPVVTMFFALGLWTWVSRPRQDYVRAYKQDILPKIASRFGSFSYDAGGKIPMEQLKPSKIIPFCTDYDSEDYFEGAHKGSKIRFAQITLKTKTSHTSTTTFRGVAILIDMPGKFTGHTIVVKNAAKVMQWIEETWSGLRRADLVDPAFEKLFTVYTTDQVEARYLVDPVIIERLTQMAEIYEAAGITAAYYENRLLVMIPSKGDSLKPAGLEVSAEDKSSLMQMEQGIEHIFFLIDQLLRYQSRNVRPAQ